MAVAYVSLLLNDEYLSGVLTLVKSLHDNNCIHPIILLFSKKSISFKTYNILNSSKYFHRLVNVDNDLISSENGELIQLCDYLNRKDLKFALTKLNVWKLIEFERIIYLDCDMLINSNIDHLFDIWLNELTENDIIASSDSGWPDIFNSGLFIIKPSINIFNKLIKFHKENYSFDGADQGLLNEYFNLQTNITGGNWYRLPFTYNCTLNSNYEYLPALIRFKDQIKVFHFIGLNKPWKNFNLCFDNNFAKIFESKSSNDLENLYEKWWDTFKSIQIPSITPLEILQISNNIPTLKEQLLPPTILVNEETTTEKTKSIKLTAPTEIINPFLSPTKSSSSSSSSPQSSNIHFPTYYYKHPNSKGTDIKDQTTSGEAWKMSESKIQWPETQKNIKSSILPPHLPTSPPPQKEINIVDEYVNSHPIFPWESKKKLTRTFDNGVKYEPPLYSIQLTNSKEDNNNNDDNDDNKLIGFDDGNKFDQYLHRIEQTKMHKRNNSGVTKNLHNEVDLDDKVDEEIEKVQLTEKLDNMKLKH